MKFIKYASISFLILFCMSCEDCLDIMPMAQSQNMNTPYSGYAVSTNYGGSINPNNPNMIMQDPTARVGAIYDTRQNSSAPTGDDWGKTINRIIPQKWTVAEIGQVYAVTTDNEDNIYLASSDIYTSNDWNQKVLETGNINRPGSCTQIFKCSPPLFDPIPFANLPNSCDKQNGIGDLVYDRVNNQFFASNLEDGKIYKIDAMGAILESYDPWLPDNNVLGITNQEEQVWGIGINYENQVPVLYFPKIDQMRTLYSLEITNGSFPPVGSEKVAFSNLEGTGVIIPDVAFSADGTKMVYSEYENINNSQIFTLENTSGNWTSTGTQFYVGDNIAVNGGNTAGGVDFGPISSGTSVSEECDQLIWTTGKYLKAESAIGDLSGLQAMDVNGNNQYSQGLPSSNSATDLFIDFDGYYTDPCDLGSSLILNAGFEELTTPGDEPNDVAQLNKAKSWVQATDATSDLYSNTFFNGLPWFDNTGPPNNSDHYAGGLIYQTSNPATVEYIGACLTNPIQADIQHSISMLIGTSQPTDLNYIDGSLVADIVILGIPACNFPIAGINCKEDEFDVITRIPVDISAPIWENIGTTFTTNQSYPAIMFGISCTTNITDDISHFLVDDIIIIQGEPCTGTEIIIDYPGDVELFRSNECLGSSTLNDYIN